MRDDSSERTEDAPSNAEATPEEKAAVNDDRKTITDFIRGLSPAQIKNGDWFAQLLTASVITYTKQVDANFFQSKYPGVPRDAVVDQRIALAARYAAVEGGLSASAYTGAVALTLGSAGGASALTVPAALTTLAVDVAYLSQLQLRLAYDVAVLYGIPLDMDDPEDLWKLIRVAFTIKGGEALRASSTKVAPALVRPLLKKFYSGSVLSAAKGLPVVGRHLLQRSVIKVGIPLVGIPLAVVLNRWTTLVAGRHARSVFRTEAEIREKAHALADATQNPRLLLWVAWLIVQASHRTSEAQAVLLRDLTARVAGVHQITDARLESIVSLDPEDVWSQISASKAPLDDIVRAAETVARIEGSPTKAQTLLLEEIRIRCTPL